MRIWSVGSVVITALLYTVQASTISTNLQSGFSSPSLLLELSEGLGVLNQTSYFPFLRHLAQHPDTFTLPAHESYQRAINHIVDKQLLDEFTLSLLKLEMATRTYAPMVVAQYQLYNQTTHEIVDYKDTCVEWMQFKDKQACSVEEMRGLLNKEDFYGDSFKEPNKAATQIYQTDHVYRQSDDSKVVVLYGDPRSSDLLEMQEYLEELDSITYVFRYRPWSQDDSSEALGLSGYGVELALKSTEYKVTDDRDLEDRFKVQAKGQMREQMVLFEDELKEPAQVKGLTEEQVKGLGLQAAQLVVNQPSEVDQLARLGQLAQNLPRYAHLLADHAPVNQTLRREIKELIGESGDLKDFVSINGYTLDSLDPFHLTQHIRKESTLIRNLQSIGLTQAQAVDLLVELGDKSTDAEIRFDMRDQQKHAVMWMNDLEHDKRYSMWPSDLGLLGRVMYPGMIQRLRQNLVQVIFALDLSDPQSWAMVLMEIMNNVQRGIPMQFGVVPLIGSGDSEASSQMAKWLMYVRRAYKKKQWQEIVRQSLVNHRKHTDGSFVQSVREEYQEFIKTHKKTRESKDNVPLTWDQIQETTDKEWLSRRWEDTREYCKRLDLVTTQVMFVNGIQMEMSEDYQEEMFRLYQMQVWELAQRLRAGEFSADDQVGEILYGKGTLRTRSDLVYESDTNPLRFAQLAGSPSVLEWMDKRIQYLSFADTEKQLVSVWVVGDFSQLSVRQLAREALEAAKENEEMQVALIQYSEELSNEDADVDVPQILYQIMTSSENGKADRVLEYLKDPESSDVELDDSVVSNMEELFEDNQMAVQLALGNEARGCIVVNGRVLSASGSFGKGAFEAMAQYELNQRTRPILQAISKTLGTSDNSLLVKVSATVEHGMAEIRGNSILKNKDHDRRTKWQDVLPSASVITVNDPQQARLRIQSVVDPLSEDAQKWIPILQTLIAALSDQVSVELWLRPQLELKEVPIKRFYRYLWPSQLEFSRDGKVVGPQVEFDGVPKDPLLTLGMDVPAAWLVSAVDSVHDLDNIRLSDTSSDIAATYRLTNILVEGHLVDMDSRSPVRGLEVQLGTKENPAVSETIVMANLGYLQLKANPGVWRFNIRPGGRSANIYRVNDVGLERWNYQRADREVETDGPILVTTFSGVTVFPLVSKRQGKEDMDVLDEEEEESAGGLWGKLKGSLSNQPPKDHLDIFGVASGHLYERLMSIMILSVLENTKSHVKFWLIENFLSPSFKTFVPKMAQEFGFDYEFITYKWPQWLHQETEKQRTIWGYKILFLDVMFPLSLDRVIFVDADQIVRADLQELASMDLKGAPYGYTPFCDDRKEIDGYRFWKQGWWKDHLRGKPYHISALYVVDLKRFRQLAAGDRLRGQYQALSRDGGSLANLDQDLPNNMQHLVPIHSLPQEWLWCETWCSDQSLKKAKTIDLCNNPMTKEPKLERARRLLPEWEVYDRRVAEFSKKLNKPKAIEHDEL